MKIQSTNNQNSFKSSIKYNKELKKGFELAKDSSKKPFLKDLNYANNFLDSMKTILKDDAAKSIEFLSKSGTEIYVKTEKGEEQILKTIYPNEGYQIQEAVKKYTSNKDRQKTKYIEELKEQLLKAIETVDSLKEKYSQALSGELLKLEKEIKNHNS